MGTSSEEVARKIAESREREALALHAEAAKRKSMERHSPRVFVGLRNALVAAADAFTRICGGDGLRVCRNDSAAIHMEFAGDRLIKLEAEIDESDGSVRCYYAIQISVVTTNPVKVYRLILHDTGVAFDAPGEPRMWSVEAASESMLAPLVHAIARAHERI